MLRSNRRALLIADSWASLNDISKIFPDAFVISQRALDHTYLVNI